MGSDGGDTKGKGFRANQERDGDGWGCDGSEGCSGMQSWGGGGWFGRCMPLHIPLFLRNDRTVGLRDHIVGYLGFGVILEGQSPLIIIPALSFIHCEIGPLQVFLLGVELALACLEPAGSADLCRFLLVVRVIWVVQVLGDRGVSRQPPGFAVAVSKHVLLGAVVTFEGLLAAA